MDDFLKKKWCERCGEYLDVRTMSMFNIDVICMACKDKEMQREDYRKAVEADHAEIKRGNYNFKGIGYNNK
jgi:hypothetical protein